MSRGKCDWAGCPVTGLSTDDDGNRMCDLHRAHNHAAYLSDCLYPLTEEQRKEAVEIALSGFCRLCLRETKKDEKCYCDPAYDRIE